MKKKNTNWINISGFKEGIWHSFTWRIPTKLYRYGVRGLAHNLLKSYFSGCKQLVYTIRNCSKTKTIQFGVPHWSNLGPILFSIYVNDIFNILNFTAELYADDSCLYVKASNETDLETLMNHKVEVANLWMKAYN